MKIASKIVGKTLKEKIDDRIIEFALNLHTEIGKGIRKLHRI